MGGGPDLVEDPLDGLGVAGDEDRMAIHIEREVARFIGGFNLYPGGARGGGAHPMPGGGVLYQYLAEPEVMFTRGDVGQGMDRTELFPQTASAVTSQAQQPLALNHPLLGPTGAGKKGFVRCH